MAAISPLNTPRLWVDYNDGNHDHSIMVRFVLASGVGAAMTVVHNLFTGLSGALYAITILGARMSFADSPVSFPVVWSGDPSYGTGVQPAPSAPLELCYVGRTLNGVMGKWFVYGCSLGVPDEFRFFPGDNAALDSGRGAISDGVAGGTVVAIDGAQPNVYPYINIQFNSYWESQARR